MFQKCPTVLLANATVGKKKKGPVVFPSKFVDKTLLTEGPIVLEVSTLKGICCHRFLGIFNFTLSLFICVVYDAAVCGRTHARCTNAHKHMVRSGLG